MLNASAADLVVHSAQGMTGLIALTAPVKVAGPFDNRPTWDNPTPAFDNRPTWDNWSNKNK
ncbi:multiple cyclophane-containing RiPP AmcA [Streptomyces sp. NPDC090085]|uniref:multiple cyclophane-containing RiPP AmcA n=1 Tax=Streptomyces sp. NPDC090085 TaxID=3365943 RepID=UPI0037F4D0C5